MSVVHPSREHANRIQVSSFYPADVKGSLAQSICFSYTWTRTTPLPGFLNICYLLLEGRVGGSDLPSTSSLPKRPKQSGA